MPRRRRRPAGAPRSCLRRTATAPAPRSRGRSCPGGCCARRRRRRIAEAQRGRIHERAVAARRCAWKTGWIVRRWRRHSSLSEVSNPRPNARLSSERARLDEAALLLDQHLLDELGRRHHPDRELPDVRPHQPALTLARTVKSEHVASARPARLPTASRASRCLPVGCASSHARRARACADPRPPQRANSLST